MTPTDSDSSRAGANFTIPAETRAPASPSHALRGWCPPSMSASGWFVIPGWAEGARTTTEARCMRKAMRERGDGEWPDCTRLPADFSCLPRRGLYARSGGVALCMLHGLWGLRHIRSEMLRPPSHTDAGRFPLGESKRDEQRRPGLSMHATEWLEARYWLPHRQTAICSRSRILRPPSVMCARIYAAADRGKPPGASIGESAKYSRLRAGSRRLPTVHRVQCPAAEPEQCAHPDHMAAAAEPAGARVEGRPRGAPSRRYVRRRGGQPQRFCRARARRIAAGPRPPRA